MLGVDAAEKAQLGDAEAPSARFGEALKKGRAPLPLNPMVVAIRARYRARAIAESSEQTEDQKRALAMLLAARRAAPGLLGIDAEIESLHARLHE